MGFFYSLEQALEALDSVRDKAASLANNTADVIKDNPGKAALGAVIGVGAVAAAPFTGGGSLLGGVKLISSLAGMGAITTATGAAVTGAVVSAHISDTEKALVIEKATKEIEKRAKAEHAIELEHLKLTVEKTLKESTKHYDDILALIAVAISVANCDGEICESEKDEIKQFISGKTVASLPSKLIELIEETFNNPLNIQEAFQVAINSNIDMAVFDEVIEVAIHADDIVHVQEQAFLQAWQQLKDEHAQGAVQRVSFISHAPEVLEHAQMEKYSQMSIIGPAINTLLSIYQKPAS